jgi:glutaredoxin
MSETVPTITIKDKQEGHVRLINESDFDSALHEKIDAVEQFDTASAKAFLDSKGVTYAKNAGAKKLAELVEEVKALKIVEKDGKFVIVNGLDEEQGQPFNTKEEADSMLQLLTGK